MIKFLFEKYFPRLVYDWRSFDGQTFTFEVYDFLPVHAVTNFCKDLRALGITVNCILFEV